MSSNRRRDIGAIAALAIVLACGHQGDDASAESTTSTTTETGSSSRGQDSVAGSTSTAAGTEQASADESTSSADGTTGFEGSCDIDSLVAAFAEPGAMDCGFAQEGSAPDVWESASQCTLTAIADEAPFVVRWEPLGTFGSTAYAYVGGDEPNYVVRLVAWAEDFGGPTGWTYPCAPIGALEGCMPAAPELCVDCTPGDAVTLCGE